MRKNRTFSNYRQGSAVRCFVNHGNKKAIKKPADGGAGDIDAVYTAFDKKHTETAELVQKRS